jgi:hypothetical protein
MTKPTLAEMLRFEEPLADAPTSFVPLLPSGPRIADKSWRVDLAHEQREILATALSPTVSDWVDRYSRIGQRPVYLWKWCVRGLDLTTLPCVVPTLKDELCDTKLLAVMLGVLLDDVADQAADRAFLRTLLATAVLGIKTPLTKLSPERRAYVRFTAELWSEIEARLKTYPCYELYEELLDYDHQQIFNTMRYSCLVNRRPTLMNLSEHDLYMPHNMQMMSFATMDLMCAPSFCANELGALRELVWHAQCMGRIGNLITTWRRELADGDFSSGVFARAVSCGDLTADDLVRRRPEDLEAVIRARGHESHFLLRWQRHRRNLRVIRHRIRSFNAGDLVQAYERLIHMEIASRGQK